MIDVGDAVEQGTSPGSETAWPSVYGKARPGSSPGTDNLPVNFTRFKHPVLAVSCPNCRANVGVMCKRPSEHTAGDFHSGRKQLADKVFIAQHGESASIDKTPDGWIINPIGYRTKAGQISLGL